MDSEDATAQLKMPDLIQGVMVRTGLKRTEARAAAEAVLAALEGAISSGQGFQLAPLGRAKVQKRQTANGAEVIVIKLRNQNEKKSKTPLAAPEASG